MSQLLWTVSVWVPVQFSLVSGSKHRGDPLPGLFTKPSAAPACQPFSPVQMLSDCAWEKVWSSLSSCRRLSSLPSGPQDNCMGLGHGLRSNLSLFAPGNMLLFLPQMWKFTQSRWVVRKEVAAVTKVSDVPLQKPRPCRERGPGRAFGPAGLTSSPPPALHGGCEGLSGAHGRSEDQQRLGVHTALRRRVHQETSRCGPAAAHAVVGYPGQVRAY